MSYVPAISSVSIALALAGTSVASTTVAPATVVERDGSTLEFYGPISASAVERALKLLPGADTLEINSPGGDNQAAIALAEAIAANKLDVVVNGNCYSSCAHYVFMAGDEKIVSLGSVMLFHGSPYAWERLRAQAPEALSPEQAAIARRDAESVEGLYPKLGIDPGLLACVDRSLGVWTPSPDQVGPDPGGSGRLAITGTAVFAAVSPSVLAHYGVRNISYHWFPEPGRQRDRISTLPRLQGASVVWIDAPDACIQ